MAGNRCRHCGAPYPALHKPDCTRRRMLARIPEQPPIPPWPDTAEEFTHMMELALTIEAGWKEDELRRQAKRKRSAGHQ